MNTWTSISSSGTRLRLLMESGWGLLLRLAQVRLPNDHVAGGVVSSVLLGGIVANGLAAVWIVTQGDFQRVDQGYVGDVRVLLLS